MDIARNLEQAALKTHGVKVGDDLVQEPQALEALIVDSLLGVEIREIRYTGKQHAHFGVALTIEIVVMLRARQKMHGHVWW